MRGRFRGFALAALVAAAPLGTAQAVPIVTLLEDATNGGGFFAEVTFEDTATDKVRVSVDIADPINEGLTKGDILGLFLDVSDPSVLPFLSVGNGDPMGVVTAFVVDEDNVTSVGGPNNNLNGTALAFDIGIGLGANGGALGFNQFVAFDLMGTGLSTASFADQLVAARVQSIEGDTRLAFSEGSSKLTGSNGGTPVPEPGTLALLGAGLIGASLTARRRRHRG